MFVFHYLLVIMAVIRRCSSGILFNEPSLEEQFSWLQWKWETWEEAASRGTSGRKVEAKDLKRKSDMPTAAE